jgi:hypothetical protein
MPPATRRALAQGGSLAYRAWSTISNSATCNVQTNSHTALVRTYATVNSSATPYGSTSRELAGRWLLAKQFSSSIAGATSETATAGRVAYQDFSLRRKASYWTKIFKELSKFRLRCARWVRVYCSFAAVSPQKLGLNEKGRSRVFRKIVSRLTRRTRTRSVLIYV